MSVVRFSLSLEEELLNELDQFVKYKSFANRSQALRNLIEKNIVEKKWHCNNVVAGAIVMIYDHHIKLGYQPGARLSINTDFSLAHFKTTDPGPDTLNAIPGNSLDITRGYWSLTAENSLGRFSGTTKLFYNFGEHAITDGFHSNDKNYGLNIYETTGLFNGNNITIGADYLVYRGKAENEKYGTFITDTTVYDAGLYGFVQKTLFEKLTVNLGLRLQQHKIYGTEWIPAGGFGWKVLKNTTWKTSVSKGFRSPTIRELFVWNHNVNLRPESIMNYETGILQDFPDKKINIELTGFIVTGYNMIITIPNTGLQNAGDYSFRGHQIKSLIINKY